MLRPKAILPLTMLKSLQVTGLKSCFTLPIEKRDHNQASLHRRAGIHYSRSHGSLEVVSRSLDNYLDDIPSSQSQGINSAIILQTL